MAMTRIYKIVPSSLWAEAERTGRFVGAPVDHADGFIHFSAADQLRETATKHFSGQTDLLLVTVEAGVLGPALKWEPSRGGALFPHLYAALSLADVADVCPLPSGDAGRFQFPEDIP